MVTFGCVMLMMMIVVGMIVFVCVLVFGVGVVGLIFGGVVSWFLLVWVSSRMFWVCFSIFCVWVMMFLLIGVR